MGKRQDFLKKLFEQSGHSVNSERLIYPNRNLLSKYSVEIFEIYKQLGGIEADYPVNLKHWDIVVDGIAVELDEEQHFNRYREQTLQSDLYKTLPDFPLVEYRQYCNIHKTECLEKANYGDYWSNDSAKKQFGQAAKPGVLDGTGSPRWKQRAFYDFLRDLTPLIIEDVPFARISIWDEVTVDGKNKLIKNILDKSVFIANQPIFELVQKRILH